MHSSAPFVNGWPKPRERRQGCFSSFGIGIWYYHCLQMWQAQAVTAEFAGSFALVFLAMEPLSSRDQQGLLVAGS